MTEQETAVCRRFLEGATYTQIARELRIPRNTVASTVSRMHKKGLLLLRKNRRPVGLVPPTDPGPPPLPPTPAMIRLAKFDPVIARAVELRTALAA